MSFATTPEQRVRELRRSHIQVALGLINHGHPQDAATTMIRCLEAQATVAGCSPRAVS